MSTPAGRLSRLLNLVPYLLARPGIKIADAAADLGVTERQLRDDLNLLWVCGLPGYGPGDLIDMSFDGDSVTVTYDAGINRPLRLTADEALALIVALRLLVNTPGLPKRDAVERALARIEAAAGDVANTADNIAVQLPVPEVESTEAEKVALLRAAVERQRALRLVYYTAGRDETTERVVDPMRVLFAAGWAYLEAWCRRARAVRLFRVDRMDTITELDEPAAPPPDAQPTDLAAGIFRPTPDLPLITLRVTREARWIVEYYPCEQVIEEPDGTWLVSLRASDLSWARRLVLRLTPHATVLAPRELIEAVTEEARAALAAYRGV